MSNYRRSLNIARARRSGGGAAGGPPEHDLGLGYRHFERGGDPTDRALMLARQSGGRARRQVGGSADPNNQKPEISPAAQSNVLPSASALGASQANAAEYGAASGALMARQANDAAWSGAINPSQAQQPLSQGPASQPGAGAGLPTPSAQSPFATLPTPPQNAPAASSASMQGYPATPSQQGEVMSAALRNALQIDRVKRTDDAEQALRRQPQPTQGLAPATNAVGENVLVPGRIDNNGNQIKSPVDASVDRANKDVADASGLTDKLRQKKMQENVQQTDPLRSFIRRLLNGQYSGSQNNQQQPQQPGLQRPMLGNQPQQPSVLSPQKAPLAPLTNTGNGYVIPDASRGVQTQSVRVAPQTGGDQTAPELNGRRPQQPGQPLPPPLKPGEVRMNNAEQDRQEKEALSKQSAAPPSAPAQPATQPYKPVSIGDMARKNGKPLPDNVPDQDQSPHQWLTSKHYFGVLGGTMTGDEAIRAGIKYGQVNAADVQPLYTAAQEEYKNRQAQAEHPQETETPAETTTASKETPAAHIPETIGKRGNRDVDENGKPRETVAIGDSRYGVEPKVPLGVYDRSWARKQIEANPALKERIINRSLGENLDPKANLAVIETIFNRAHQRGISLVDATNIVGSQGYPGYYPMTTLTGGNANMRNPQLRAMAEQNLENALRGSDISRGATDNSSNSDGGAMGGLANRDIASKKFLHQITYNGEYFFRPGPNDPTNYKKYAQWSSDQGLPAPPEGAPSPGGGAAPTRYAERPASPTAGSAGTGTPEQNARLAALRRSAFWREFFGGNPMLGYEQADAEQRLLNGFIAKSCGCF
jgi:hypothetical protein